MGKNETMRTCVGCRMSFDKKSLIRVIRTPEGTVKLDVTGRANGRGAYICKNSECFKKAKRSKGLARSLNTEIPEEVYECLLKELEEYGG